MKSFSLAELAEMVGATIKGRVDLTINKLAPIATATQGELSFVVNASYRKALAATNASAVLVNDALLESCPTSVTALVVKNPELSFAKIATHFDQPETAPVGVHPTAVIADNVELAAGVSVGPKCVIEAGVKVGANTIIKANTFVGENSVIGEDGLVHPNVVIYRNTQIGHRVLIHSGVVLGADGFGFTQDNGQWRKIPQLGRVIIGDDVELGSNSTIDRGALEDTVIANGVKIDNLVQIGHNVAIGDHSIIAGCVGIAGSTKIGKYCMVGGGACVNGHLNITDNVIFTGMAGVHTSIKEPGIYSSFPMVQKHREWVRNGFRMPELDKLFRRVKKLEAAVATQSTAETQ